MCEKNIEGMIEHEVVRIIEKEPEEYKKYRCCADGKQRYMANCLLCKSTIMRPMDDYIPYEKKIGGIYYKIIKTDE